MELEIIIRRRTEKEQKANVDVSIIDSKTNEEVHHERHIPSTVIGLGGIWVLTDQSAVSRADAIAENLSQRFFNAIKKYFQPNFTNREIIYSFCGVDVFVEKPYALNGVKLSLKELSNKLSRISLACAVVEERITDIQEQRSTIKKKIRAIMRTPEDILYCLENKVPFY